MNKRRKRRSIGCSSDEGAGDKFPLMAQSTFIPSPIELSTRNSTLRSIKSRQLCLRCNRLFTFRPFYLRHLRDHHVPIPCKSCGKGFVFRSVYIRHISIVHGNRLRKKFLSRVGDAAVEDQVFFSGKRRRISWLQSDTFDFVCPHCFYESFNESDIRQHVFTCHSRYENDDAKKDVEVLKQLDLNAFPLDSFDKDVVEAISCQGQKLTTLNGRTKFSRLSAFDRATLISKKISPESHRCRRFSLLSPERVRARSDGQNDAATSRRKSADLAEVERRGGLSSESTSPLSSPTRGEDELDSKRLDLATIDERVDFRSSQGLGDFLKEVIDYLADGTEEEADAPVTDSKISIVATEETRKELAIDDDDLGVTRIRSKRIAGKQRDSAKTPATPRKFVEFVSLEEEGESAETIQPPLENEVTPICDKEQSADCKKPASDIQKMLLAYSCDSSGRLILRPSRFSPTGVTGPCPSVSRGNPFGFEGIAGHVKTETTHDPLESPSPRFSQVVFKNRKRRRSLCQTINPELTELVGRIESCSLEETSSTEDRDFFEDESSSSSAKSRRYAAGDKKSCCNLSTKFDVAATTKIRTLRRRENVPSDETKSSNDLEPKKETKRQKEAEDDRIVCCNKPLSMSRANREKSESKTLSCISENRRCKTGTNQSSKENAGAANKSAWYWPPNVGDMVVGLFEDGWYIGKALDVIEKGDKVKIKFMEDRNFKVTQRFWKWPRANDVQVLVKCSILNVRPEVKLLDKTKGECTKKIAGGVYEVTNLEQIQEKAKDFYRKKRPTAPDITL